MANAVRKIYTKIGNGHQYLLSTAKTSVCGCYLKSDTVPQHTSELQVDNKCELNRADNLHRQSRHLYSVDKEPQPMSTAVVWFNKHDRLATTYDSGLLKSTIVKPDNSSTRCDNHDASNSSGLPSAEQLHYVFDKLGENLPTMFKQNLDYSLYHPKLMFENNIRGKRSVGVEYFMSTISILRLIGHLKYAFVKFDILKITKHPKDGTIKVWWRIKGISDMKVFFKFWKFRLWNVEQVIKENIESWHDGFSIFYLGSDGLVHKLTADKMQPDNGPVIEEKNLLATKLALFLGLSSQLNNLNCLMTFDSEQVN